MSYALLGLDTPLKQNDACAIHRKAHHQCRVIPPMFTPFLLSKFIIVYTLNLHDVVISPYSYEMR